MAHRHQRRIIVVVIVRKARLAFEAKGVLSLRTPAFSEDTTTFAVSALHLENWRLLNLCCHVVDLSDSLFFLWLTAIDTRSGPCRH